MWQVVATGVDTGSEYVYNVEGPKDGTASEVFNFVCRQHGIEKRKGNVSEFLNIREGTYRINEITVE